MSPVFEQFFAQRLAFPGLAGWGARLPDDTLARQSSAAWLTPGQADRGLARLILAAEVFKQHNLNPQRLCWVFDQVRVFLALRADRSCLVLWVPNQPDWPKAKVEGALEDFLRLPA